MISANGSVKRQVTCESCGHSYEYEMSRTAYGSFSGFAMTRAEADEKEAENAVEKLKVMLTTECDIVPCPKCSALTRQMREASANFIPQCVGAALVGAATVLGVFYVGKITGQWFYVMGILGVVLMVLSGFFLVLQFLEFACGSCSGGWQPKVKPKTARGIAYSLVGTGIFLIPFSYFSDYRALVGGGVSILFGIVILIAAQCGTPCNPSGDSTA